MISRKVIGIDFDDVVADFNNGYINHHNKVHRNPPMTYEEAHTFDLTQLYKVDEETIHGRVMDFCHRHHHHINPIEGVHDALEILSGTHELHIVTSRCESLGETTVKWLEHHGLDVFDELHFTNSFSRINQNKRSKHAVCEEIGASFLIEDAPGNALEVGNGGIPVLMPHRPWNTKVDHHMVTRFGHWQEAVALIAEQT